MEAESITQRGAEGMKSGCLQGLRMSPLPRRFKGDSFSWQLGLESLQPWDGRAGPRCRSMQGVSRTAMRNRLRTNALVAVGRLTGSLPLAAPHRTAVHDTRKTMPLTATA